MAEQMSGLDMVREIIGQINNLRRLITFQGKTYKLNTKTGNYEADGRSFTKDQLKSKLQGQSYKAPKVRKNLKIKNQTNTKTTPKTSVKTKVSKAANNVKKVAKNLKIKNIPKGSLVKGVKTLGAGVVFLGAGAGSLSLPPPPPVTKSGALGVGVGFGAGLEITEGGPPLSGSIA